MSKPVRIALIGAGNRRSGIFGKYALDLPHRATFVAVVEPDDVKRNHFAEQHNIPPEMRFSDYKAMFAAPTPVAEAIIIATLEDERNGPAFLAMEHGYPILIEKPLGTDPVEIIRLADKAADFEKPFIVCHQMRHVPCYDVVKELVDGGALGKIVTIQHRENVGNTHMAHSFVRGLFNNSSLTPIILAKCCHDMDLLCYLIGKKPLEVASFGSLKHFRKENAPEGAPAFCLDGCPASQTCPYDVLKLYFNEDTDKAYLRQMGVIRDKKHLMEELKTNRFGRCVYHCDNDVVDNQVMSIRFEDDTTVNFTLCGHNGVERRFTRISMTNGEIEMGGQRGKVLVHSFEPKRTTEITPSGMNGTHGGGDKIIMDTFVEAVRGAHDRILTSVRSSLDSHLVAYAAEESRKTGTVINIETYEKELRQGL